jgi:hypothetical protein
MPQTVSSEKYQDALDYFPGLPYSNSNLWLEVSDSKDWRDKNNSDKLYLKPNISASKVKREKEADSARVSSDLRNTIAESSRLLELTDDWDGEGSLGYSEKTRNKAIKFLEENAINFHQNTGTWITAPDICPGPNGSIDLLWKLEDRRLLINIPVGENNLAGYYGDNSQNGTVRKGKLNLTEKNEEILIWLMK